MLVIDRYTQICRQSCKDISKKILIQMALIVEMLKKICSCVSTLWGLQELRFEAVFDSCSYATMAVISTVASCVFAVIRRWKNTEIQLLSLQFMFCMFGNLSCLCYLLLSSFMLCSCSDCVSLFMFSTLLVYLVHVFCAFVLCCNEVLVL